MLKQIGTSQNLTEISELSIAGTLSALVYSGECAFHSILIKTDGTNNVIFSVYNGLNAEGSLILIPNLVVLGSSYTWSLSISPPKFCSTGIFVAFSVTGGGSAKWQVQYVSE